DQALVQKIAATLGGPVQLAVQYARQVKARDALEVEVAQRTTRLRALNARLQDELAERERAEAALQDSNSRLSVAVSELKRAQQQVIQQERLRAMGQMASGIAHD